MPVLDIADCINETCPWSGDPVQADSLTEFEGHVVGFCNPGCLEKFERAISHFKAAIAGVEDAAGASGAGGAGGAGSASGAGAGGARGAGSAGGPAASGSRLPE